MKVDVHPEFGHVSAVEVDMDLEYKGGFKLATDADLVLGKCAALCVKGEVIYDKHGRVLAPAYAG